MIDHLFGLLGKLIAGNAWNKNHDIDGNWYFIALQFNVDNKGLKFFLDTGAKLSYLANSYTANDKGVGK